MKKAKTTLIEAIIGIWIFAVVVILAGVFFVKNPLAYALGEIIGSITATFMMIHLYQSIEIELSLPEDKATKHSKGMAMIRTSIQLAVLFGSCIFPQWVMPLTVFLGMLGRKFAALSVPLIEKIKTRKGV